MTIGEGPRPRAPAMQAFLGAVLQSLAAATRESVDDAAFVREVAARLRHVGIVGLASPGPHLPALRHLDAALAALGSAPAGLRQVGAHLAAITPEIPWYRRAYDGPDADRFAAGHANALLIGPGGMEERADILLGVSLMAPGIRYPDHRHPPDELYLVLSDGEWRRGEGEEEGGTGWFRPGIGGTVRNPPDTLHTMRSGAAPLLAVWALLA